MNIGLIGLGKMGFPLLQNMRDNGMSVAAHDINAEMRQSVEAYGATFYETIQELIASLGTEKKVVWLMLPAGAPTETVFQQVLPLLNTGDILIEGGNTHYEDSKRRYKEAAATGISFFDVGTSGGTSGARNGACMMVGGDAERFKEIAHIFEAINIEKGYLYAGESGSGHYLKMVHNGIEYGMMQAIGEGFNLLHHSEYSYDLEKVARVWNHGSVIRSWLMELTESLLMRDAEMADLEGAIPSSGEGKWTVEEALRLQVALPVITQALMVRFSSTDQDKYGEKVIASLRNEFGGHAIPVRKGD